MSTQGENTYREITSQAEAWAEALEVGSSARSALQHLWQDSGAERLLFTGCGSTHYLSLAAAALAREKGLVATAMPGSEVWLFPDLAGDLSRTLLVAVSRSGETTETVRAIDTFRRAGGKAVVMVGNYPDSAIAKVADLSLAVPKGQEVSVAQTRSFASMLVVCRLLVAALAGEQDVDLSTLPGLGRRVIETYGTLAEELGRNKAIERFFFLGSGPRYGLACEAMLKMKEMSLSYSEAYHPLEFRHGPKSVVTPGSLVVGLLSDEAYGPESNVLADMKALGARTLALVDGATAPEGADHVVRLGSELSEADRLVLFLPALQLLAFNRAIANGQDPDNLVSPEATGPGGEMSQSLSSRERMLRAMRHQDVDHVPCAFMSFSAMRGRCQDAYEVAEEELALGLDSWIFIPSAWRNLRPNHPDLRGLPVHLPPEVRTKLWLEEAPGEQWPILHKEYHTPTGVLTTTVRKTDDWPHGNFVPFIDDYQIPRAVKPLVTTREDVAVLRSMLQPPSAEDIAVFQAEVERARAFSARHGILIAGGWGVGADMAGWLCGLENMMLMVMDNPALLEELLATIAEWTEARMRVILEAGVDLLIRRGWYEGADFWSPRLYRQFLLPEVKRQAELAHEYGVLFGYNMTTGALPMIDNLLDAGIDVLIGVDPLQRGDKPLETLRDRLGGRICLWGGVNGAITVEEGNEEDVRQAVRYALSTMRGTNGFILSPVDNITEITQNAWRNVGVLVEAWRSGFGA